LCGVKLRVNILVLVLLSLLSFFSYAPSMCLAETVRIETETLTELKKRLAIALSNNEQLGINLEKSDLALTKAEERLEKSDKKILELEQQLTKQEQRAITAENYSTTAANNLKGVNQLLTTYQKETQAEIKALKQKNKLYELGLLAMLLFKR
jgi:hypothetical protein